MRPISAASIPLKVVTLGGIGTWPGVRGEITSVPKVPSTLGGRRVLEGDGEGTVAGSEVYAEMSAANYGTDGGGESPSLDFIVQVWGAGCRTGSAGAGGTRVMNVSEHINVPSLP